MLIFYSLYFTLKESVQFFKSLKLHCRDGKKKKKESAQDPRHINLFGKSGRLRFRPVWLPTLTFIVDGTANIGTQLILSCTETSAWFPISASKLIGKHHSAAI